MKEEHPQQLGKVRAIGGDLAGVGLGISAEERVRLASEVGVVFHVGATVKFDDPLKTAVEVNLGGTASVLELCKEMQKLEVSYIEFYLLRENLSP